MNHRLRRAALAIAFLGSFGASFVPAIAGLRDAHATTQGFRYEDTRITAFAQSGATVTLTLRRGSDDGVYVGATGVIYAGDSKDYLKDGGKAVAFVVDKVDARTSTVHVTAGTVTAAIAAANPRVVVRAKEYKDLCSARTAATVNGIAIDDCVFKRIRRWDAVIDQAAKAHGLDPNLVRGLIAAETGGDTREVSTSGYMGLMQASKESHLHLEAETSIEQGAAHLASKIKVLKKFGYDKLTGPAQIEIALAAYNAGEGTVAKALEYARASGDAARWAEEASYVRALIYYGAYDSEAAFPGWVEQQPAAQRAKLNADKAALIAKAQKERVDFRLKDYTVADLRAKGASGLTIEAAMFKMRHSPGYRKKAAAYSDYFAQHRS